MIQTNNYEFNIVEGGDIVNPLIQLNPNFTKLDTILKAVADTGIGSALQVKSGTNHAITKDNDCAVFRFIATADYNTGDTFTLNGDTVTVRCMDGTVPKDRAFVINQNVLVAINGTLLTLIGANGNPSASEVDYNNAVSGLTATKVQGAIDEVKALIVDSAEDISYNNATSGLTATNVQEAIDEVALNNNGMLKTYQNIAAINMTANVQNSVSIPVTQFEGYTALGVLDFTITDTTANIAVNRVNLGSTKTSVTMRFTPSVTATNVEVRVVVLYAKTQFVAP